MSGQQYNYCYCDAGYYGNAMQGDNCTLCPPNFYCSVSSPYAPPQRDCGLTVAPLLEQDGNNNVTTGACGNNAMSPAGSGGVVACRCVSGYYGTGWFATAIPKARSFVTPLQNHCDACFRRGS